MNLEVDRSANETLGVLPPSDVWTLGRAVDGDRSLVTPRTVTPGTVPYSHLAECECPDDCLRDHENE
jgi:hypothetical protein